MQSIVLSKGELDFQYKLIQQGMRIDGRGLNQVRSSDFKYQILPLSPASCQVFWGNAYNSKTEVIVSISTEIYKTPEAMPHFSVKSLPNSFDDQNDSQICQVVQTTLLNFLNNSGVLEPSQFIIPNSPYSWKLFIDVLIIKAAGAVYEASMLGIRESLRLLSFPELIISPGETMGELIFDIDESKPTKKLINEDKIPYVFTFAASGDKLLIDPTPLEVTVLGSMVIVCLSKEGNLLGLDHFGNKSIDPEILTKVTVKAQDTLQQLLSDQ